MEDPPPQRKDRFMQLAKKRNSMKNDAGFINKYQNVQSKIAPEWREVPDIPLDFSFKDLASCPDIIDEEPRSGRKKGSLLEKNNNGNSQEGKKEALSNQQDDTEVKKPKRTKEIDQKKVVTSILLSNNKLSSIQQLDSAISAVVETPERIEWIDLSCNSLKNIDEVILRFPQIRTLYLHANKIDKLQEVDKLSGLKQLHSLTLHGNPIENLKGYRQYVLSKIPGLKHLDFSIITKQTKHQVEFWNTPRPKPREKVEAK